MIAADETERVARRWWRWLPIPTVAVAAAALLLVVFGRQREDAESPAPTVLAERPAADAEEAPGAVASRSRVVKVEPPPAAAPAEPPPALVEAPDLFVELPILRNMEKLENFEAIYTTLDGAEGSPDGQRERSSG
jgi:hypothetical protein